MLQEEIMEIQNNLDDELVAYKDSPFFFINEDEDFKVSGDFQREYTEIRGYYRKYKLGSGFVAEGSNLDYIPSDLRYKKAAMIINKEARFLFANPPSFNVNKDDVDGEYKDENAIIQNFLDNVLEKNNFNGKILKALKDCFIGKRVALVVNFNPLSGINITFLNSLEFLYETSHERGDELVKFMSFYKMNDSSSISEQRWFKKKYIKNDNGVYLTEEIYSGNGELIEEVTTNERIKLNSIPVSVILNDGLTGEVKGESELGGLIGYEKYYSKLANADMDAERKSMNPIRYTIDASEKSTSSLSSSPGSYWDLQSDDTKANENVTARVGTLEAQMNYSGPLKITLERIENEMYSELDVPNITSEQLAGVITSGKTIQALYWGLTVRCDEKMLAWTPALRRMAEFIIEGAKLYPECIKEYTDKQIPDIPYDIVIENNYPIPEDVVEEKTMDVTEVEANIMSRKAYLKKWRGLNDDEADKELAQIKLEQEMLENSVMTYGVNSVVEENDEEENEEEESEINDEDNLNEDEE